MNHLSKISSKLIGTIALLLVITTVFFYYQPYYLPRNFSLFLGLIFAPFIIRPINYPSTNRFLLPAMLFGVSLFFIKTNSLYYGFGVCLGLYSWESRHGQLNNLPFFLLVVISFLVQQVLNNWSFPIRLQLSAWAGEAISLLGYPITVRGNMIFMDGQPFSVDPACMGLKMMITAQLLALVIFAYFERKNKLVFSFSKIAFGLLTIILLTILANFIRLLALIIFKIMPDNPLHDIIGLVSLVVYALLPFYFGVQFLSSKLMAHKTIHSNNSSLLRIGSKLRSFKAFLPYFLYRRWQSDALSNHSKKSILFSKEHRSETVCRNNNVNNKYLKEPSFVTSKSVLPNWNAKILLRPSYVMPLLVGLFLYQGIQSKQPIPVFAQPYPTEKFVNFEQSKTKAGILKLENDSTLIYIKPPVSFFQGSHDPRVCWRGSGYLFQNIQVKKMETQDIYTAILKKDNEQFYTAWWYDNLENTTIEEWQWRLERLQGRNGYFLVNVSCNNRENLISLVSNLINN